MNYDTFWIRIHNFPIPKQDSDTPLHCEPEVISAMKKIWMKAGNGTSRTESAFVVGKIRRAKLPLTTLQILIRMLELLGSRNFRRATV